MNLIEKYLGEGVSQYKKLFTTYAKEIAENIIKEYKFESEEFKQNARQVQSLVVSIMGTMALPENNPNYVHKKKLMPKNFKKELFDNGGGGNVYNSEWMNMNDSHQFTIARDAMMEISKEKMNNVLNRNDLIK